MNKILLKTTFRTILVMAFISLSFLGSDCNKIIETLGGDTGELTGTWQLIYNGGTLNDICPGENANFLTNGVAELSCPGNGQSISRIYTNLNYVLTYTETNIQYNIKKLTTSELELEGANNNRYLYYTRVTSTDKIIVPGSNNKQNNNSSESNF